MKKTRKSPIILGVIASAVIGMAYAGNLPTLPGEFYIYYNQAGEVVGTALADCDGQPIIEGTVTNKYRKGTPMLDMCYGPR